MEERVVPKGMLSSRNANVQKPPGCSTVVLQRHNLPEIQRPGMGLKMAPGRLQQLEQPKPNSGPNIRPGSPEIQKLDTSTGSGVQPAPRIEMRKSEHPEMRYLVAGGAKIRQRIASKFQKPLEKSGTLETHQMQKSEPPAMQKPTTPQKPVLLGIQMPAGGGGLATLQKPITTQTMQQIKQLGPQRMQEPELARMQRFDGGPKVQPTQLQKFESSGMQEPAGGPKIAPTPLQNDGMQKIGTQNVGPLGSMIPTGSKPPAPTSMVSQPGAPVFSRPLAIGPVPRTPISIGLDSASPITLPSRTQASDSTPVGLSHPPAFPQSPVSALHASTSSHPPQSTPLHRPKTEVRTLGPHSTTVSHSPIRVSTSPSSISVPLVSDPNLANDDIFSLDEIPSQEDDPSLDEALNLVQHVFDIIADNWQVLEEE